MTGLDDDFVLAMARQLADHQTVFVGANQVDVALAAYLARALWAPNLRVWAAGSAQLQPHLDQMMVGRRSNDKVVIGLRGASFAQARAFEQLRDPVFFGGGLQVDGRGNTNLAGIRDGDGRWRLRGPGSAGLPSLSSISSRFYIAVSPHTPRSMVDRCSRVSIVGDPLARRELGLVSDALAGVITPIGTFRASASGLVLTEIARGLSVSDVQEASGFPVTEAPDLAERVPVGPEEQSALSDLRTAAGRNQEETR